MCMCPVSILVTIDAAKAPMACDCDICSQCKRIMIKNYGEAVLFASKVNIESQGL